MTRPPTLLELLHPSGRTLNAMVLGSGAPAGLLPDGENGPADIVLIAPGQEEADQKGWVDEAVDRAAAAARNEGMLYVMLPPRTRRSALRRLRALGFASLAPFVHYPTLVHSEHLVPIERASLQRWLEGGDGLSPFSRNVASATLTLPGIECFAATVLPDIGVAAFSQATSGPFGWLARASGCAVASGRVRAKWRGGRGGAVVIGLDGDGTPVAAAKIALGGDAAEGRASREAERLAGLGPAARQAGALVPSARLAELPGGWPVLILSPVPGRPAASLLGSKAQSPKAVIARLAEWLVRWSAATLVPGRLSAEWIERWLVAPAEVLGPDLPEAFVAWLRTRADAAIGENLPSVATHGDLTMTNVLLADHSLSIVDWEAANATGLPLRDLLYAAADATAARDGYRDRVAAFERCFSGGAAGPLGAGLDQLRRQAGLSDTAAALCAHACWLGHAADERGKRESGESRPFLSIVRLLAERAMGGEPSL